MSIKARLILMIAFLLVAGILAMTGAVVLDARPRVETESENSARLTATLIRSSLIAIEAAREPKLALERLVAELQTLRHVRVSLGSRLTGAALVAPPPLSFWTGLVGTQESPPIEMPVYVRGELVDVLLVAPIQQDEWQEVWATVGRILEYGALIGLLLIALTSVLITRSLTSIATLTHALHELEGGNFDVAIPEKGPPEIVRSCRQLNTLAKALSASRAKVTELSARIVHVQDDERREVVRELHDDLGPHLFALRARAAALERRLLKDGPDLSRTIADATAIIAHIDAVQQTNRRVLNRLVPAGLFELGLARALSALAATWRKEQPDIDLRLSLPDTLQHIGESASLTIYRVCQEALTNAYRHAAARTIALDIAIHRSKSDAQGAAQGGPISKAVHITVADDGQGLLHDPTIGRGLQGMRERIEALGGALKLARNRPQGLHLEAIIPF